MSRFDTYAFPALARRRRNEKVLFGASWLCCTVLLALVLLQQAYDTNWVPVRATFTGSPVVDAVGMSAVMGFSLAVVVVLVWRRVRRHFR